MKRIILTTVLLIAMADIYAQQALQQNQTKDFHLQRRNNQNTTGWVLLLSGTAVAVGGLIAFEKSWDEGSETTTDILGFVSLAGVIADLISIPFFISAGANKRKAASLSFNYKSNFPHQTNHLVTNPVASMTLQINF